MQRSVFTKRNIFLIAFAVVLIVGILVAVIGKVFFVIDSDRKVSVEWKTSIPEDYVMHSTNSVFVHIPETHELLQVVIALSNLDEESNSLTYQKGVYYSEVVEVFKGYQDHPVVKTIDKKLQEESYGKMRNIFMYEFEGESIQHAGIHNTPYLKDYWEEIIPQLEDFARKSGFRKFYKNHSSYYENLIKDYKRHIPVKRIWNWLEDNIPIKHDSYNVILSPLIKGAHNTYRFRDYAKEYTQIVMFLSAPNSFAKGYANEEVVEANLSRMLFTEIDHNYINPLTNRDKNLRKVVRAFSELDKWNTKKGYRRPVLTFNEYMTWAVFLLYAHDMYSEEDYEKIQQFTVETMNWRGFVKFESFAEKLLELYENKKEDEMISDLYSPILRWARRQ
jgi:hypothetical protein